MLKRWIEWLMLETGGLFCNFGWHSWERESVRLAMYPPEQSLHGGEAEPLLVTGQRCRWCIVAGPEIWPTGLEEKRYLQEQWEAQRAQFELISGVYDHTRLSADPVFRQKMAERREAKQKPPRTPAGKSRLQAPNSDRLRRTVALLHDKSTAEVAAEVMEGQCQHHEPLHAPGRDLSTGAVVGFGPMRDW